MDTVHGDLVSRQESMSVRGAEAAATVGAGCAVSYQLRTRRNATMAGAWWVALWIASVSGLAAGASVEDEGVIDALFGGTGLGAEGRG